MQRKFIAIICNPISGKGRGCTVAAELQAALRARGYDVILAKTCQLIDEAAVCAFLLGRELVIVAGGDGTLMHLLPTLARTAIPVYLVPTGNESLFAKEFSMSKNISDVLSAVEFGQVVKHAVGMVNNRMFFTMMSVGFDAQVVQQMSQLRTGTINHFSYLLPMFKTLLHHRPAKITVKVDDCEVVSNKSGFLIIANNEQYALGINFVPEASSLDSDLHARFIPYRRLVSLLFWTVKCRLRCRSFAETFPAIIGKTFVVSASGVSKGYPVQADGEYVSQTPITVSINQRMISVLQPGESRQDR